LSGLRVISGSARGRKLRPVPGDSTRPITDRTKESLYDIIGNDIAGASLLDLFGGTGSVGIEALSRGAEFACFLDLDRLAVQTIHANLEHTGLRARAEVLRVDAFQYLQRPPLRRYDYIYIAPPQYKGLWLRALQILDAQPGWLAPDAWVIVQIHPKEYQPAALQSLHLFDQRFYGSTLLCFYQTSEERV
jgi:16S rRNA (guanine(966)-N(2))-methyltransferase RsmD